MRSLIETGAVAPVLVIALVASPVLQARSVTKENRTELENVPHTWVDARICFHEGGGVGGPRVVIGHEGRLGRASPFLLRAEHPGDALPGYLLNQSSALTEKQISVPVSASAGYSDEYREVFVMPNGIRLTCEALPG